MQESILRCMPLAVKVDRGLVRFEDATDLRQCILA